MQVAPGQDLSSLNALRSDAAKGDPQSLKKAAQQFEALLLQQMIKSMRDAVPRADGEASSAMSQYESLHDQQLAQQLARRGTLGLAETIERQLSGNPASPTSPGQLRIRRSQAPALVPGSIESRPGDLAVQYIERVRPSAAKAAAKLGVSPEVLIAQSALETGWGQFVPQNVQGKSSHNYFGIKADSRWDGEQVTHRTTEFQNGRARSQYASFRAYASDEQSFNDYADFILSEPRYAKALKADSTQAYLGELQRAGYATDPRYAEKILGLLPRVRSELSTATHQRVSANSSTGSSMKTDQEG